MVKKVSLRTWLSVATVVLLAGVVYFSRSEIMQAWELMSRVNIWLLILAIIPLQLISYYATGESMFSYLRSRKLVSSFKRSSLARLSLEMNFVNHTFPSAGLSGTSYVAWRMKQMGVSYSDSTTAQLVRLFAINVGFIVLLMIAVAWMSIDGSINQWVAVTAAVLAFVMALFAGILIFALNSERRMIRVARAISRMSSVVIRIVTLGKKVNYFSAGGVERFLVRIGSDYRQIRSKKQILIVPFIWGLVFSVCEVGVFYVTFLVIGEPIDPAPLVIAHALASVAGLVMITPGGAGLYETVMVGFLSVSGIDPRVGIAGVVLARVLLIVGTIVVGYPFYQQAVLKYGSRPKTPTKF